MSVLSDQTLLDMHLGQEHEMIKPFEQTQQREQFDMHLDGMRKIISRGLSSYGYDVTLAPVAQIFSNIRGGAVNPKRVNQEQLIDAKLHRDEDGLFFLLPPNSYLLGHTLETFDIPRNILVLCLGKSTYARAGVIINTTPIEPGFKGQVVIEVSNATSLPVRIYANEGIAQFVFLRGDVPCLTSYADRLGKYQNQSGITHSRV